MPQEEESTQNSKTRTEKSGPQGMGTSAATLWEDSPPLQDLGEITHRVEKPGTPPEVTPQTLPVPKKGKINLSQIFHHKIILSLLLFVIFGLSVSLVLAFARQKIGGVRPESQKLNLIVSQPPKLTWKRISSAFVPKIPSTTSADIWPNWKKFEDAQAGFAFFHPEEWQVEKGGDLAIYTLYYPVADKTEANFGKTVLAKLSIIAESLPQELVEFFLKRYNLSNVNLSWQNIGENAGFKFEFDNTFVFAIATGDRLYILEGKVANPAEFENFLPIFLNFSQSFQILK